MQVENHKEEVPFSHYEGLFRNLDPQAALERLQTLANNRIQSKLDETVSYVPDQYPIVQQAQVLTDGLYLALFISPEVESMAAAFEAALQ